jgi:hypothetical protein
METSVKDISVSDLESAISAVIAKFTGKDCFVSISKVKYDTENAPAYEYISFSATTVCRSKTVAEDTPF